MFKIEISGSKVSIFREVDLPKALPLERFNIIMPYTVTLDLKDLDSDPKSKKKILKSFPAVYQKALEKVGQPRRANNVSIWQEAGRKIMKGSDPVKIHKETEKKLEANWDEFDKKYLNVIAIEVLNTLSIREFGAKEAKKFGFKASYNNKGTWGDFAKMFLGVAAVTTGILSGGVTMIVAGIVGGSILALKSARDLSEKYYLDLDHIYRRLDKQLKTSSKDLMGISAQAKSLSDKVLELQKVIEKSQNSVKALKKDYVNLKKEVGEHPEGKKLVKAVNLKLEKAQLNLQMQRKFSGKLSQDSNKILKLISSAKEVSDLISTERSTYDKALKLSASFVEATKDIEDAMNAIEALT